MYESDSETDNSDLVGRVVGLLETPRAGLITDVDGTIAPIVTQPEDAHVLPAARAALEELATRIELVAVVSGRQVDNARAMVGIDGITYVGNHGLEMWGSDGPELRPEARPWVPRVASVLADVQRQVALPGLRIENKGVTASLHYRSAAEPERARRELLEVLARCTFTSGLRLEEGRMVLNLLPPLTVTKGSAVNWLAREHDLTRLVYLGDDITDAHAFRTLRALRDTSPVDSLSIGVIGVETPLHVRQLADACVPSVPAVADLLCAVAEVLRTSGRMNTSGPGTERRQAHGQSSQRAEQ